MNTLPKRFGKYGLTLHTEKTRMIDFRRPLAKKSGSASFDLLGFTHFWGKSRKGNQVVQRKTASPRFSHALKRISEWCRANRHRPVAEQHDVLSQKLQGHYGYYGITGNMRGLTRFVHEVERTWRRWLDRRSSGRTMTWERFRLVLRRYALPRPRIVHSVYATAATPPSDEPDAGIRTSGSVGALGATPGPPGRCLPVGPAHERVVSRCG